MTRSVSLLALKIAQILEEYTDDEIEAAVRALSRYGRGAGLFAYLATTRNASPAQSTKKSQARPKRDAKSIEESVSRAVSKLQSVDPEKFQLLSEFDQLVRSDKALRSNVELRQFGAQISKDFRPGKSRKDSISAVMNVLAERSVEDIKHLINQAVSTEPVATEGEFQRLAKFLIKGRP